MLNNNLLELKAEESEEININTIYFMDKPKENKKKIFMAIKEKIKPQNGNKRGRKRKGESGKGKHSKKEKDNIIRKIKVHFFSLKDFKEFTSTYNSMKRKHLKINIQ